MTGQPGEPQLRAQLGSEWKPRDGWRCKSEGRGPSPVVGSTGCAVFACCRIDTSVFLSHAILHVRAHGQWPTVALLFFIRC